MRSFTEQAPFGFKIVEVHLKEDGTQRVVKRYTSCRKEMTIVRRIVSMYAEHTATRNIAASLNAEGIQRRGENWTREDICEIMRRVNKR